ncbi:class I SAM-dependent methyltransferase [Saccharopolyspora shandongensis]|uniref:class I SAM-dependent methyltransferase n=1 Tax=Saccharopolyspora shandongensis TaxID=418495 RepID=UPI0033E5BE94
MNTSSPETAVRQTFDTVAGSYDQNGVEYFRPIAARLVELAELGAGEYVLDIGCGRGAALCAAADAVGPDGQVVGIDVSAAMIEKTSADLRRRRASGMVVAVMDGAHPGFGPGYFDAVIGSNSVHMVPGLESAYVRYRTLLAPGGRLAVCAPASVLEPEPRVFGLRSIAAASARFSVSARVYPQEEAFGGAEKAVADLRRAGFDNVVVRVEDVVLRAVSPDQFVRWTWTHGMRMMWDTMPAEHHEAVAREIAAEVAEFATESGVFEIPSPVRYFIAR